MAFESLVDAARRDGKRLLAALSEREVPIDAAFWYFWSDERKWKLVIESPWVNELGPWKAYRQLIDVVRDVEKEDRSFTLDTTDVRLVKRGDGIAERIHQAARRGMILGEGPFTGPTPAGFVEDSYVYWVKELDEGERPGRRSRAPAH